MPSPFPGMDPYLETHWLDVHSSLAGECRRALNGGLLPSDLAASIEEHVSIDIGNDDASPMTRHRYRADVRVEESNPDAEFAEATATLTLDAPFILTFAQPAIERSVRITQLTPGSEEKLITVIEFLSPSNKSGEGRSDFLTRRSDLLAAGVNVVEIDLVRQGNWKSLLAGYTLPPTAADTTYRATIHLPSTRRVFFYPLPLRERLRPIPIPLRSTDTPVQLPLQSLVDTVYDTGRYPQRMRYDRPLAAPLPTLEPEDAAWAAETLRKRS